MSRRCPTCGRKPQKLTPEQVMAIRQSDDKVAVLAMEYGVSDATVSKIRNGKAYEWVSDQ